MNARPSPLLPDIGVLALVPDRWADSWMPRHQVLRRLGDYFQVVWMDPPPHWRDLVRHPLRYGLADGRPASGLTVHRADYVLPAFHRPRSLADLAFRRRLRAGERLLRRRGCRRIVLYLWRPDFERALDSLPFDLSCYHIDDEYTFTTEDQPISEWEQRVLERVGQVFIHSPALMEKKGSVNPHTAFIPNGVDFRAFSAVTPEPADLAAIPHPRVGYAGWLKKQLDWDLLLALTGRHTAWQWVFVGGSSPHSEIEGPLRALAERPHVHFLGAKLSRELPGYTQHYDACIMPYRVNAYTNYIYPLKVHEYLATGRPAVGSPIRTLRDFADVVALPRTLDEWSAALTDALTPEAHALARRNARQGTARRHDWGVLVLRIARIMASGLGETTLARLQRRLDQVDLPESVRNALRDGEPAVDARRAVVGAPALRLTRPI